MFYIDIVLYVLIIASIVFYLVCIFCTLTFNPHPPLEEYTEPVSILIPVRGLDSSARENWLSFCRQDYPLYEVLFGVKDNDDPALPVLEEILALYPDRVRLYRDLPPQGINHQISNLIYLLDNSRFDIVILADSDIKVGENYLKAVVSPLQNPSIGVVTCGYTDKEPKSIGAALAGFGRCLDFLPSVLVARFLDGGMKFALGPTIATRKSVIEKFGGLQRVVNRIGSDYNIGKMATEAGYKIELSGYILANDCSGDTPPEVFKRELRWARTIRLNRGKEYYGMIFTFGTVYVFLESLLHRPEQGFSILILTAFVLVRLIQGSIAILKFNSPKLFYWLWLLPLRDLMSFLVWLIGSFGSRVYWRGRWLNIGERGLLSEPTEKV